MLNPTHFFTARARFVAPFLVWPQACPSSGGPQRLMRNSWNTRNLSAGTTLALLSRRNLPFARKSQGALRNIPWSFTISAEPSCRMRANPRCIFFPACGLRLELGISYVLTCDLLKHERGMIKLGGVGCLRTARTPVLKTNTRVLLLHQDILYLGTVPFLE